jgi:prepilin-type N-terminal cleavage/methylation domain-containing protein
MELKMISQIGRKINKSSADNPASLSAGITLLEVLVAISILAICIMAIFNVFISSFDAQLRAENYSRSMLVAMDALEYVDEFPIPLSQEELATDIRRITWQFTQNDIEEYLKLKEVIIDTVWEQGKRQGKFSLTTYCWDPQK